MGNFFSRSTKLSDEYLQEISEETGFNANQINSLWTRFMSLDKDKKGHLTKEDFRKIPELQNNPLGERIVQAFFKDGEERRNMIQLMKNQGRLVMESECGNDVVNFDDFVRVFAHFRPPKRNEEKNLMNTRDDKLRFAFNMYDMNNDGVISKDELCAFISLMIGGSITQAQIDQIADRMMIEADLDRDDFMSFDEFKNSLLRIDVEKKMSIRFLN